MPGTSKKKTTAQHDHIACCFQGGGALGAYQVGVMQALHEAGYHPDWFCGTSIGAINAAIAAGNTVEDRIPKLEQFWSSIATQTMIDESFLPTDILSQRFQNHMSAQTTLLYGQPGFFTPRLLPPTPGCHSEPQSLSFYDTSPLRSTLERVVDFDRINSGHVRLSVGAVEIGSGKMTYFDSKETPLKPEHIMASGALPPGFPAIEIDGRFYWDGGLSSNSPIAYVLLKQQAASLLCFMVNLFDSNGLVPTTLDEIEKRKKDIEFASKYYNFVELQQEIHALKYTIHQLSKHIPEAKKKLTAIKNGLELGWNSSVSLVRFQYKGEDTELSSKDYEFSHQTITRHIQTGYNDGKKGVKKSPWLKPVSLGIGITCHDVTGE